MSQVAFDFRAPIESFTDFLKAVAPDELVIVGTECTDPTDMLMGTVVSVDAQRIAINHFTGTARRTEPPSEVLIRDITCCQLRTHYIGFYQRHLSRQSHGSATPHP